MQNRPDYFYRQSAVIPYRKIDGQLQILMITSRKKKRWVIPKGIKEPELNEQDSAAKEALEEAGITGEVRDVAVGAYQYEKWGGVCTVEVFAMAVDKVLDVWEESYRDREWVSLQEAIVRVQEDKLKQLLHSLPDFLRQFGA